MASAEAAPLQDVANVRTLPDLLLRTFQLAPGKPDLLKSKVGGNWTDISTAEVKSAVAEIAAGLAGQGVERGQSVAILAENRPQWLMADYAILGLGAVSVPIYPTLLSDQVHYILDDSDAVAVFVSTRQQAAKVAEIRARLPKLRFVVVMDPDVKKDEAGGIVPWVDLASAGRERAKREPGFYEREVAATQPGDLATLIYTSGTTGEPKGVMLTHDNLASNVKTIARLAGFASGDIALSLLPLSHVFERMADFCYMAVGATIAYAESIDKVPQNISEIRPTVVAAVPRLYEKMYARVLENGRKEGGIKRSIFEWAMGVASRHGKERQAGRAPGGLLALQYSIAEKLVYSKVKARMGGRIRFFISGGAPLAKDICEFFYGLGIYILEGYGLSETSPVIAVNTPEAHRLGTVGKPIPGVEVRIAEDGEILCRGPNVMKGYFHKEQATREAFDGEWFRTGDIGHIDSGGFLVITDRKKDLFKTSGGKYITPQPIENQLKGDEIVAQAVLIGNSKKFVAALLVANVDAVRKRLPATPLNEAPEECVKHPQVRELFDKHVSAINAGLAQYEKIKKFEILARDFTPESGELTPTLKVKRKVVNERYAAIIDGMYAE
ncbi:MAG: long-chain fatty acid--CoA ligase [Acidobacteriota bacterium]